MVKEIKSSELIEVRLPSTKSRIVKENNGIIYCSVYKELKGSFRKDVEGTKKFGRKICDEVKQNLSTQGFFTSDELPNYGLNKRDTEIILRETQAAQNDLVVIFAYGKIESQKAKEFLDGLLRKSVN
jgi:Glu-tRNA(Gln) amidotransferase subunit E-like FAD-binding protein